MAEVLIGWIGMVLLVASFLPATIQTLRKGHSELNLSFLVPYLGGVLLSLIYALQIGQLPFVALNTALLLLVGIDILVAFRPRARPGRRRRVRGRA